MTRETKIGLLVGLAFIIIVGILLSEPLNHAGDAQPAPLPNAGQNVRMAVNTPGTANTQAAPPISLQTQPGGATPPQPLPTEKEVAKPHGGISVVVGGGGAPANGGTASSGQAQITMEQGSGTEVAQGNTTTTTTTTLSNNKTEPEGTPVQPQGRTQVARGGNAKAAGAGRATPPPGNVSEDPIMTQARNEGVDLVPVDSHPEPGNVASAGGSKPARMTAKAARQYEAAPGDSLSKIAQKFYGSSSKAYRDAIVAANPSLKADPNKILVGQAYVIPAIENGTSNTAQAKPTAVKGEVKVETREKAAPKNDATYYTVKPGDNLWAIARDQCGDPAAVAAIKELNKEALKGGINVRAGMKLKLPMKHVASAN